MADSTARRERPDLPVRTAVVTVIDGPERGTTAGPAERVAVGTATTNDLVLKGRTVSRFHFEVQPDARGLRLIDHGSKNGTFVGAVRVELATVPPETVVCAGDSTLRLGGGPPAAVPLSSEERVGDFRGWSAPARRIMAEATQASSSDASVLLLGESGTGKELLARAIHARSARAAAPFEVVDCAALVPTLVASELFGHERGAFTSADRRHIGAFERAHGGTLFLDEIGELPQEVQPLLLGALERRTFRRVGGTTDVPVDVRILGATHRDLRDAVNDGRFRLDLYYRVAVVTLAVPSLRERSEDIVPLVKLFAERLGAGPARIAELTKPENLARLEHHMWPGNIRELRNVVESTLVMGALPSLESAHGRGDLDAAAMTQALQGLPWSQARAKLLTTFEVGYLEALLRGAGGNVARAARTAEMDRSHLFDLLKKHKLK